MPRTPLLPSKMKAEETWLPWSETRVKWRRAELVWGRGRGHRELFP